MGSPTVSSPHIVHSSSGVKTKSSSTIVIAIVIAIVLVILIVNFPAAGKKKKKFKLLQPFELVLKVDGHQQNSGRDFMLRDVKYIWYGMKYTQRYCKGRRDNRLLTVPKHTELVS